MVQPGIQVRAGKLVVGYITFMNVHHNLYFFKLHVFTGFIHVSVCLLA